MYVCCMDLLHTEKYTHMHVYISESVLYIKYKPNLITIFWLLIKPQNKDRKSLWLINLKLLI